MNFLVKGSKSIMFRTLFGNGNFSLSRIWITNDEHFKHDPGKEDYDPGKLHWNEVNDTAWP